MSRISLLFLSFLLYTAEPVQGMMFSSWFTESTPAPIEQPRFSFPTPLGVHEQLRPYYPTIGLTLAAAGTLYGAYTYGRPLYNRSKEFCEELYADAEATASAYTQQYPITTALLSTPLIYGFFKNICRFKPEQATPLTGSILGVYGMLLANPRNTIIGGPTPIFKDLTNTTKVYFDNIAGGIPEELKEAYDQVAHVDLYTNAGVKPLKSLLLVGAPGNGKTMMAQAFANQLTAERGNVRFLYVSAASFMGKYIGDARENVESLFAHIEKLGQEGIFVILFIDEFDALGNREQASQDGSAEGRESVRLITTLLTHLDGVKQLNNYLLIGATNQDPEHFDKGLIRSQRFDRIIYIPAPDQEQRLAALQLFLKEKGQIHIDHLNLDAVSQETEGFSHADITTMIEDALRKTVYGRPKGGPAPTIIAADKLQEALKETKERVAAINRPKLHRGPANVAALLQSLAALQRNQAVLEQA